MNHAIHVYVLASAITFLSYQVIPNALEANKDNDSIGSIVHSAIFTSFVRFCGVDHAVMALLMFGMHSGWFMGAPWVWNTIAFSSSCVAVVSAISAITIRRAVK